MSVDDLALASRFAQAKWLWTELTHPRERWDAPRHPFYERWFAGELTSTDLQLYASEHHHAIVALARASCHAAALTEGMLAEELSRYADDQEHHVELWCAVEKARPDRQIPSHRSALPWAIFSRSSSLIAARSRKRTASAPSLKGWSTANRILSEPSVSSAQ